MPDRFAAFTVRLENVSEFTGAVAAKRKQVLDALYDSMVFASVALRGRVVGSFGTPGYPRRGTGGLSRGIRGYAERSDVGSRAVVGVAAIVPYGRILEFGGTQPARVIRPIRKRALRWTSGMTRLGSVVALDFGATRKEGFAAPRSKAGRAAQSSDTTFAKRVYQPSRFQRPIPYLGPALEEERPNIQAGLRARLAAALA